MSISSISESRFRIKLAAPTVFEHKSHVLKLSHIIDNYINDKYLTALLNSAFSFYFTKEYLNSSVEPELNDLRLFPIIIPTPSQREEIEALVNSAIEIQKRRYAIKDEQEKSLLWQKLKEVQEKIDKKVEEIYG